MLVSACSTLENSSAEVLVNAFNLGSVVEAQVGETGVTQYRYSNESILKDGFALSVLVPSLLAWDYMLSRVAS